MKAMAYPSITKRQRDRSRSLRLRQTDAEQKLWQRLRGRQINGAKFRRQYPIGPYFADFCCVEQQLIVELDGSQHAERGAADEKRTTFLAQEGYRVIRFWDNEVLTYMTSVLERIATALKGPHPDPLPKVEGERRGSTPVPSPPGRGLG